MIVVKVFGGLGNQMFQYALYRKFIALGNEAKLDVRYYDWMQRRTAKRQPGVYSHNSDFTLGRVFSIQGNYITQKEAAEYIFSGMDYVSRAMRKLKLCGGTYNFWEDENVGSLYQPEYLSKHDGYFEGCWTSFLYTSGIEDILRREFVFQPPLSEANLALLDRIRSTTSVSVHVRRGDYLKYSNVFCNVSKEYYGRAVRAIRERVGGAEFFLFSDDVAWCRNNLDFENITYVEGNSGPNSYVDMLLMSACRHNILANSTFSMWGAWLNPNPGKIVIRPEKYYIPAQKCEKDLWPDEWMTV